MGIQPHRRGRRSKPEADSSTDTCHVGTITWTGGSIGTGIFTPDGTLGPESNFTALQRAHRMVKPSTQAPR